MFASEEFQNHSSETNQKRLFTKDPITPSKSWATPSSPEKEFLQTQKHILKSIDKSIDLEVDSKLNFEKLVVTVPIIKSF